MRFKLAMRRAWQPTDGMIIPSTSADLKEGQWTCSGGMKEGPLLRQELNRLLPDAPRHEYRGAPVEAPCGSKRFVLAFYHDRRELYVRCDTCGAPYAIVQVKR
jgi:hypothetical protein